MSRGAALSPTHFEFNRSGTFLQGSADVSVSLDASGAQAIAAALRDDTAFPPGTLHFGTVAARASAGSGDIQFDGGQGIVSFSASGTARGGLGVYTDPFEMVR